MNLTHEYALARTHVSQIDFTLLAGTSSAYGSLSATAPTLPLFETSIRYLGGLLSAHDLSSDSLMLERAVELADWILPAFDTYSGLPIPRYRIGSDPRGGSTGRVVLSEVGSMSMEFARLSILTGKEKYWNAVKRAADYLETNFTGSERKGNLLPTYVVPEVPDSLTGTYSFGAQGDSYYEYLIKTHQLLGGTDTQFARMYNGSMESAWEYLIKPVLAVPGQKLLTIGQAKWSTFTMDLEHLTCFAGGMMGLGAKLLGRREDMEAGKAFTNTCYWAYRMTKTGVGPDSLTFWTNDDRRFSTYKDPVGEDFRITKGHPPGVLRFDRRYLGRPETIESVFYMWRLTGDRKWMDAGWRMFVAYVEHCMTDSGLANLDNIDVIPAPQADSMESFVFAETLKYYFLLFDDPSHISLDDYVLNTEAHPLRILKPETENQPPYLWTGPKPQLESRYAPPYFKDVLKHLDDPTAAKVHRGQGTALQQSYRVKNLKKFKPEFLEEKVYAWRQKFSSS
ncbi:glycoside hydrolase family 47 protein [Atractiella rhizophila]|nr:glycoside hydrolase family 47 protein [Atractiella rhizophila]